MSQAGVAYVTIKPDWTGFQQDFNRGLPRLDRQLAPMGAKLGSQFVGLGKQASLAFAKGATAAAGVAAAGVGAALVGSIKVAADFEAQLSSLGSVSGASSKEMDAFRKSAIRAGADTKFSALDAAKAQTELAKGGLGSAEILGGGLTSSLALAAAGELELADAASTTVNAMKLFDLPGKKAISVANAFATAANSTTADVSDFALALNQTGSAAQTVGLSFPETIAALETLAEVGVKGSDAGTSLKTALIQLASPSSNKAAEMADKLGLKLFDSEGRMKSLVDVSAELQDAFKGLTDQQRIEAATTLVGQDGFRALLALYEAGPKKVAKLQTELTKEGTAAEVAKKKQDNLKGSLEQLGGSVETLGIQVGSAMIPAIRKGADEITDFTGKLGKVLERDDLDLGEKLSESFRIARVELAPWVTKLKREIVKADIPEEIGELMDRVTERIERGIASGDFGDALGDQFRDADLAGRFGELVDAATPRIVEGVSMAARAAAGAFVKAFMGADAWGKLALGAWLLSKMGGVKTFRALGATAGLNFNAGATTAGGVAALAATAGTTTGRGGSKLPKQPATLRPVAGNPLGTVAAGVTMGSPLVDNGAKAGLTGPTGGERARSVGSSVKNAARGGAGSLPIVGAGVFTVIALNEDAEVRKAERNAKILAGVQEELEASLPSTQRWREASEALDVLNQNFAGSPEEYQAAYEAMERLGLSIESTPDQVKDATKAFEDLGKRFEVTQQLLSRGISLPSEITEADGQKVGDAIDRMASGATKSIKGLRTNVRLNTKLIKTHLGEDTLEGKQALSANFRAAAENIERSMKAGTVATKEGTAEIERLMVLSLQQFGFSKKQALNIAKTGDDQGNAGREGGAQRVMKQRGGAMTGGLPSGDSIPALLERGEYVVNREAVKQVGVRALDQLNFAHAPRFQEGGIVELLHPFNDPAGHGGANSHLHVAMSTVAAIVALGRRLQSMGWLVSEQSSFGGVHGGHAAGGYHPRDQAIDVNWPDAGQEAAKIQALLPMLQSGQISVDAPEIKRLLVGGPDSPLKTVVQSVVDTARSAAQSVVERAASSVGMTFEGAESAGDASGNGADLMRKIAGQRGWNFADWWAIDGKETGHGANLTNPTSTARLRGQFLDMNWGKYGPGSDPRQNPSMAQQIQSMAAYIGERYGNPTKALAFHNAHNYYRTGGLVGMLLGGAAGKTGKTGKPARFAGINLGAALKKVRTGRSEKLRGRALNELLESVNGIQFTEAAGNLTRLAGDVDLFGEYADRAGALTDTGAIQDALEAELTRRQTLSPAPSPLFGADAQQQIVDSMLARVSGGTQLEWLVKQATSMFDWRNVLVDTAPWVQHLRDQTSKLLVQSQERLQAVVKEIEASEEEIERLVREREKISTREDTLEGRIKDEMDKPRKKRDEKKLDAWRAELAQKHGRHVEINARLSQLRGVQRGRGRERDALEGDKGVIAALTDKHDGLKSSYDDIAQNITDVQGIGAPLTRLPSLPALGVLGGKLFDTQKLISDLTNNPPRVEATVPTQKDEGGESASILRELLDESNLRTAVSERAFDVFKQFDLPPYGGSFSTGGVVPGPVGAARTIIAHGGEEVVAVDDVRNGGAVPQVHVNVAPGMEWLRQFISFEVDRGTRQQARTAARALPGGGGGLIQR